MKVKVISKNPKQKGRVIDVDGEDDRVALTSAIHAFNTVFEQVKEVIFERTDEIEAIRYAILAKEHVMLEGVWGIAKSMLANQIFNRITGAKYYKKLLMKGTSTDESFGPMNANVYRTEARWEHNTSGFLPEAHFAFIDETYRGSDSLLGSLMGILNEREFLNGPVLMNCPLITAIGTTNFITESEELEAFHDRWLIRAIVKPIQAMNARVAMLKVFSDFDNDDQDDMKTVSLSQIERLQGQFSEVSIDDELLELFERLCLRTIKNTKGSPYLSDRRLCLALKLVFAHTILDNSYVVKPENIFAARFGICKINDEDANAAFQSAYENVIGDYQRDQEELETLKKTKAWVANMQAAYDPALSVKELVMLKNRADEGLSTIKSMTTPANRKIAEGFEHIQESISVLVEDILELPNDQKALPKIEAKTAAAQKVQQAMMKNKKALDEDAVDAEDSDDDIGGDLPDWAKQP